MELALFQGQRDVELARMRPYHETGRLIHARVLRFKDRAAYDAGTIRRLAAALKTHRRQLQRCVQFARSIPNCATWHNLARIHDKRLLHARRPRPTRRMVRPPAQG